MNVVFLVWILIAAILFVVEAMDKVHVGRAFWRAILWPILFVALLIEGFPGRKLP